MESLKLFDLILKYSNECKNRIWGMDSINKAGIRLFIDRKREDKKFMKEFNAEIQDSNELLMLGNTFRDFFRERAKYNEIIANAIKKGIKFKILLLDPRSEHARKRAIKEQGELYGMEKYDESILIKDITEVTEWLYNVQKSAPTAIEVLYYDSLPMVFLIKTRDVTFIEFYHTSRRDIKLSKFIPSKKHTPLLIVENASSFGRFLESHFEYIWKKAKKRGRTLEVVYNELHPENMS